MIKLTSILRKTLLLEDSSFSVNNHKLKMRLKPNINPTKQGVRIQFALDESESELSPADKETLSTGLQKVLNKALSPYGMSVNEDPDVPHQQQQIIGFYLTVEQLEMFIKKAVQETLKTFKQTKEPSKTSDDESSKKDKDKEA